MPNFKATLYNILVFFLTASPLHWNYDRGVLDGHLKEANGKAEFFKWSVPFYQLSVGAFSCYGDQGISMLQNLVENKGTCEIIKNLTLDIILFTCYMFIYIYKQYCL